MVDSSEAEFKQTPNVQRTTPNVEVSSMAKRLKMLAPRGATSPRAGVRRGDTVHFQELNKSIARY
jgi:hypothetical protein